MRFTRKFVLKSENLPDYKQFENLPPSYDADKAQAEFDALSEDDKANLSAGVAVAVGNDQALPYLRLAAADAADAVRNIDDMFISLTANLVSFGIDAERFLDSFAEIKTKFRGVVSDSQELAVKIAQYGESFDQVVIKFCADSSLTVERRIQKINGFIQESEGFKSDAQTMQTRFVGLTDDFSVFVGSFSTWARDREDQDNETIGRLQKDIGDLDEEIARLDKAIKAISATLAGTLPITGILAIAFFPLAPIIMAVGCAIAGLELVALTGLLAGKNSLANKKRGKEAEIKGLQDEIGKIAASRTQLEITGKENLAIFTTNVAVLSQVWGNVVHDATDIRGWLEDGAADADVPEYMKLSLDAGAQVYKNMAQYLKNYANGVTMQQFISRR